MPHFIDSNETGFVRGLMVFATYQHFLADQRAEIAQESPSSDALALPEIFHRSGRSGVAGYYANAHRAMPHASILAERRE